MWGNKARSWVEIDLNIFSNNLKLIRKHIGNNVKMLAVIKADAYGHGALELAKVCQAEQVDYLAVACVKEGIELRKEGINLPILILSYIDASEYDELIEYNLIPTVYDEEMAIELNALVGKMCGENNKFKIHLKIDTGMTRLGFSTFDITDTVEKIKRISKLSNIEIDGMLTHYADSDNIDTGYCDYQFSRFSKLAEKLEENDIYISNKHTCNSAGVITEYDKYLDMVRCGIIIYGCYPEKHLEMMLPGLLPPLSWKARLAYVRNIEEDITVSYGRTYTAKPGMKIGVVAVGYADGYSRMLSNKFHCIVNGKKVPITGRVCMDQLMVDLTEVPDARVGDIVTLIGNDGDASITATEMADAIGTISYEVLCDISKRVERIYR